MRLRLVLLIQSLLFIQGKHDVPESYIPLWILSVLENLLSNYFNENFVFKGESLLTKELFSYFSSYLNRLRTRGRRPA